MIYNKITYCRLPRTASYTSEEFIRKHVSKIDICAYNFKCPLPSNKRNNFIFGFVRNPWDYWVSNYFWNIQHNPTTICDKNHWFWFNKYQKLCSNYNIENTKRFRKHFFLYLKKTHSLLNTPDLLINDTFLPLKFYYDYYFLDNNGNYRMNYIGRYESLLNDWTKLLKILLISKENELLQHFQECHCHQTNHIHYSRYYTNDSKKIVKKMEKYIIKKYNYKFKRKI